jgi:hypothetical protein
MEMTMENALTVGGTWTGSDNCVVPLGQVYDYFPSFHYWYSYPTEPLSCIGKAHVFECDREKTCKCGKVTRVMPKAKR